MKKVTEKLLCLFLLSMTLTACSGGGDDPEPSPAPGPNPVTGTVSITTPQVSDVTYNSAKVKAQVTASTGLSVSSRGICYSTSSSPTTNDKTVAAQISDVQVTLTGLEASTTYYVRGYAVSDLGTTYSEATSFTTAKAPENTLENYVAPTYADDYRTFSGWNDRAKWNLSNVHDPSVMLAEDGYYYMYCTDAGFGNPQAGHGHFHCRRSKNLVDWEYLGATMQELPGWVKTKLNEIRGNMGLKASTADLGKCGYWAPCVRKVRNGLYRMYYVITIDGTIDGTYTWGERAFIGLMESSNPADVNSWQDKGFVITNYSDKNLDYKTTVLSSNSNYWQQCYYKYNAIDPSYIITPKGEHWLVYGSWHSGFAAVQINAETGKTIVDPLPNPWGDANETAYGKRVFTRKAGDRWQGAEAPEVIYKDGYYYMFLAYDALEVPYNTRVVRSENIDGPYQSITGTNVSNGGEAFPILTHPYKFSGSSGWVGISHCAIFDDGQGNWYYASQARFPTDYPVQKDWAPNAVMLGHVRSIRWTKDGWPVVMPERYGAVPQVAITEDDIVGTWEHIDLAYSYGKQKVSSEMVFAADHTITSGTWKGAKWSFDATTNTLTANGVELLLQRECDWEASPRKATIVYAGINNEKTYWGKKSK